MIPLLDGDVLVLKEYLDYIPETGKFIRKKRSGNSTKIGEEAGNTAKTGYVELRILNKRFLAHRLAFLFMKGYIPEQVDHRNMIRNDNRWENLREADNSKNTMNRKAKNTLGIKNVYLHKLTNTYNVKLQIKGKTKSFGYYKDLELADLVAQEARNKYHGEFARHD